MGDRHQPPLRTSTIASGLYAGPVGSTVGQQPFGDDLTVQEEQPPFRGWLLGPGRLTVTARAQVSERSMVSVWLTGFEDQPQRCREVCVFEIFADTVTSGPNPSAAVGAGIHPFRDPALREEFSADSIPFDPARWHRYAVTIAADACAWDIDGAPMRTSRQAPAYPLQIFTGVFDFPDRESGATAGHEPWLEIDEITFTPGAH